MMYARDLMTTRLTLVNRRATLKDAAVRMREENIGILPVVDKSHVVGMLSDRDLVVRGVASGVDTETTLVEDIMTPKVVSCSEDRPARDLAELMHRHGVHRLLVVNGRGKPVGIVSATDLAKEQLFEAELINS